MALFTPVGERRWVDGWDPEFPAGEEGDGSAPGTCFRTHGPHGPTLWVVAERSAGHVRYGRITPGLTAGLVDVRCTAAGDLRTAVEVEYDLTALGEQGESHLAAFAREYERMMDEWRSLIATAVRDGRG